MACANWIWHEWACAWSLIGRSWACAWSLIGRPCSDGGLCGRGEVALVHQAVKLVPRYPPRRKQRRARLSKRWPPFSNSSSPRRLAELSHPSERRCRQVAYRKRGRRTRLFGVTALRDTDFRWSDWEASTQSPTDARCSIRRVNFTSTLISNNAYRRAACTET